MRVYDILCSMTMSTIQSTANKSTITNTNNVDNIKRIGDIHRALSSLPTLLQSQYARTTNSATHLVNLYSTCKHFIANNSHKNENEHIVSDQFYCLGFAIKAFRIPSVLLLHLYLTPFRPVVVWWRLSQLLESSTVQTLLFFVHIICTFLCYK